jgi:Protein of unknown function (DUF3047)
MRIHWLFTTALLCLGACATPGAPTDSVGAGGWHAVLLPGKDNTRYEWDHKDGRGAWSASSERSASMWRRHIDVPAARIGEVSFSWWVQDLITNANVAEAHLADAPARVMFAFGGNIQTLPPRTRMMFDLAEALTGERPPFATLIYVWDAKAPVGTVIHNPRSDRIRKIVVDSGAVQLRRWRDHRRDLAADYRLAFGEAPGPLTAIALMTDSDNTQSRARSWYGAVDLH